MRYATWRAVSTLEQVEGVSLDHQLLKCRESAAAEGWSDTGLVFTADGYSRTGYINLSDAERDIPALRDCLQALRSDRFDVLVCFNYDRFGDLIVMIANDFRNHKKQLYSVSQPTPVFENYDVYMDDSSFVMQAFAPIWDKMRKSDLRRKYRAGIPKRIEQGLTPLSIPYGYQWRGKKEIPEPIFAELELVNQMRLWLLSGIPLTEIKAHCDQSGLLSPRGRSQWDETSIKNILSNPYYTGQVVLYKTKIVYDPKRKRKKKQVRQPRSKWLVKPGKHKAIWTVDELSANLRELERRRQLSLHSKLRYPLSGLLYCSECGKKLYRHSHLNASAGGRTRIITCNKSGPSHVIWEYDEALPAIARKIQDELRGQSFDSSSTASSPASNLAAVIEDLKQRRTRVQQSAELGAYTPAEASARISEIERQIEENQSRMESRQAQAKTRAQFLEQMRGMLDYFPEWMLNQEPATVHRLISSLIARIVISPEKSITIEFR